MIANKSVYLKKPKLEDLYLTEILLQDEETMSFNKKWGGTVPFPKEKWEPFFKEYIENSKNYYFHIYNLDNQFIGEVSSRKDEYFNSHILNIKIMYIFRGNNHGNDALECFLDYFFSIDNNTKISDNVALDNDLAIKTLSRIGFEEMYRTQEYILMELRKENF